MAQLKKKYRKIDLEYESLTSETCLKTPFLYRDVTSLYRDKISLWNLVSLFSICA